MEKRTYPADWARRLRALRARLHSLGKGDWTQEAFAGRIGLSPRHLQRAETAEDEADDHVGRVGHRTLARIAEELWSGALAEEAPPDLVADAAALLDEVRRFHAAGAGSRSSAAMGRRTWLRSWRDLPPPWGRYLRWLLVLALLGLAAWGGSALLCPAPVVTGASIDGLPVSPERCTAGAPCPGLAWQSRLRFTLAPGGHAAVYLETAGLFYLQDGNVVPFGEGGSSKLFPGEEGKANHGDFRLYVVTRRCRSLPRTRNDQGLTSLPSGRVWGPVVLTTAP